LMMDPKTDIPLIYIKYLWICQQIILELGNKVLLAPNKSMGTQNWTRRMGVDQVLEGRNPSWPTPAQMERSLSSDPVHSMATRV
jgi:hypothetical protein